jgi:putative ABC transport system permease protein
MIFFEFAKRSIRLHWLRSLLAVIGIVIGVVAIASTGILGNSLVLSISEVFTDVGDTVVVYPAFGGGEMGAVATGEGITDRQVNQIIRAAAPKYVIPLHVGADRIEIAGEKGTATIYGMNTDDIPLLLDITEGIYLRGASATMAGKTLTEDFDLKVGSRIMVGDEQQLRIVGILDERGMGLDINPDNALIVSDRWYEDTYEEENYDQVIVKVRDINDVEQVTESIEAALNKKEKEVIVINTGAILESIISAFNQISLFITAIGGISLLVAGVSIFNVQMMSVTERIKEIGIIRSIGTRRREVMRMFLYEAILLGFIGAAIGGVLSFVGGYVILTIMLEGDTRFLFAPSSLIYIPYGMLFGIVTSILSGVYPAWKAATLNPIEALRQE